MSGHLKTEIVSNLKRCIEDATIIQKWVSMPQAGLDLLSATIANMQAALEAAEKL